MASREQLCSRPAGPSGRSGASSPRAPLSSARETGACAPGHGTCERGVHSLVELARSQLAEPRSFRRDGCPVDAKCPRGHIAPPRKRPRWPHNSISRYGRRDWRRVGPVSRPCGIDDVWRAMASTAESSNRRVAILWWSQLGRNRGGDRARAHHCQSRVGQSARLASSRDRGWAARDARSSLIPNSMSEPRWTTVDGLFEALGRDVAIKILPSVFTTDPDRRARFDRGPRSDDAVARWRSPDRTIDPDARERAQRHRLF